jgi:uncharacterized phage protein (TIGR01671 family)
MKREFKFRAWHELTNKFYYFEFGDLEANTIIAWGYGDNKNSPNKLIPLSECIVQQYSGLIDCYSHEICEGDIVKVYDPKNKFILRFGRVARNVVSYDKTTVFPLDINGYYFEAVDNHKAYYSIIKNSHGVHDLNGTAVIGNIFENKELLT